MLCVCVFVVCLFVCCSCCLQSQNLPANFHSFLADSFITIIIIWYNVWVSCTFFYVCRMNFAFLFSVCYIHSLYFVRMVDEYICVCVCACWRRGGGVGWRLEQNAIWLTEYDRSTDDVGFFLLFFCFVFFFFLLFMFIYIFIWLGPEDHHVYSLSSSSSSSESSFLLFFAGFFAGFERFLAPPLAALLPPLASKSLTARS